jgi:hypothetical protein
MSILSRGMTLAVAGAGAVLSAVMMTTREPSPTATPRERPAAATRSASARAARSGEVALDDVKLELLQHSRAALEGPNRNPFRFEAKAAPAPAAEAAPAGASPGLQPAAKVSQPVEPAGPPPPPPIPLRFIGLVEAPTQAGRVAILSDGKGNVFYGKEGDSIEGRYRMLKIGLDAVEVAYVDGRGRQMIRLSGQ